MAEEKTSEPKGKKKASGKSRFAKLNNAQKTGVVLGGALVTYLGFRWYQNRAAASAAAATPDSTTVPGGPSADQPADIATGGATPGTETGDPFQVADPANAAGETYGQELDDLESQVGIDDANWAGAEAELEAIVVATGATVNPPGSTGSGTIVEGGRAQAERLALIDRVAKATGLSTQAAGQQVALYLEGKPLTDAGAVNSITNALKVGGAPTANGTLTLPAPTLAKAVTQNGGASSAKTSTALANAEAVAKKDEGTPAEKQAQANVARTKTIVAKQ